MVQVAPLSVGKERGENRSGRSVGRKYGWRRELDFSRSAQKGIELYATWKVVA
jgi:hypothetical protein